MISDKIIALVESKKCRVQLLVDNTQALLHHIRNGSLDIAMVEGEFDKNTFGSTLMKTEEFLGICSADHPFAGKKIAFDEAVSQNLILREHGSGTRSIFENQLNIHGESIASFSSMTCISSFVVRLQQGWVSRLAIAPLQIRIHGWLCFPYRDIPKPTTCFMFI